MKVLLGNESQVKLREEISLMVAVALAIIIVVGVTRNIWSVGTVTSYVPYFAIAGIVAVLGWGFKARFQTIEKMMPSQESGIPHPTDKKPKALVHEKSRIRVDDEVHYKMKLRAGEWITGTLVSEGFFSTYFFTESSFRTFDSGGEAREIDGTEDVKYYEPHFNASRTATYYIVIMNEEKKNIIVDVDLDLRSETDDSRL